MRKVNTWIVLTLFAFGNGSVLAGDQGSRPCEGQHKGKHEAGMAIKECLKAWIKDIRPDSADPGDDCTAKTSAFVQAVKALKACRAQAIQNHKQNHKPKS